ncbi:MAG: hypothetical protein GY679_00390 [Mycoplasma sp.]|nr:hypothetical protein [Mycoplasma sp.]
MNKKLLFYEVHPRYFKDYSGNGVGDLRGLGDKMEYFSFLGVDAIILPDLFATHGLDFGHNYKNISKEFGTINDLRRIISIAKSKNIYIILDLNIGSISESHNWFKASIEQTQSFENIIDFRNNKNEDIEIGNYKYDEKTKSFYIIDSKTQEVSLNWSSDETLKKFIDVVKFWSNLGVAGFTFTNFENINNYTKELMTRITLKELRKFYLAIKNINNSIIVIGKTDKLIPEAANEFTEGANQLFDYMQINTMPYIGCSEKYGLDVIGNFSQNKLVKELSKHVKANNDIITFGSINIGRITSRWGDEGQYAHESAKSLGLLLLSTSSSACIYYGDELGIKNLELTNLNNFHDETINERKRALADLGISEKRFMQAQILQNPINAKSLMPWNSNKNGGFSLSDKTISPISQNYRLVNVEIQFRDIHSPMNFYKTIIGLIKNSKLSPIMKYGSYKIKIQRLGIGVIHIIRSYKRKEVHFLINLSKKEKSIIIPKKGGEVIYSSYGYKKYNNLPNTLQPFESIIIAKETDNAIRENFLAEKAKEKAEIQRTKEIELRRIRKLKELKRIEIQRTKEIKRIEIQITKELKIRKIKELKILKEEKKLEIIKTQDIKLRNLSSWKEKKAKRKQEKIEKMKKFLYEKEKDAEEKLIQQNKIEAKRIKKQSELKKFEQQLKLERLAKLKQKKSKQKNKK